MSSSPFHYGGAPTGSAVASAAAPLLTEGSVVKLSVDLSNNLRTTGGGGGGGGTSSVDQTPFVAGTTSGTPIMGEDPGSGELLIPQLVSGTRILQVGIPGGVATTPVYSHTISAGGLTTVTSDALLLAQNLSRVSYQIQNVSLSVIYVLEGTGTCSATNFTYALPGCGLILDGTSPIYRDTQWQGPVRFCAATGTGKVAYAEKT